MKRLTWLTVTLLLLIAPTASYPHGGGLDKKCGHHDHMGGGPYHYHPERCEKGPAESDQSNTDTVAAPIFEQLIPSGFRLSKYLGRNLVITDRHPSMFDSRQWPCAVIGSISNGPLEIVEIPCRGK